MARKKKERELLLRDKYRVHLEDLNENECKQWLEAMFYYRETGGILENISSGVKAIIRRQIEEREEDKQNYQEECERQSKRMKDYREKKKSTTVHHGIPKDTTDTNSNSNSNINILSKDNITNKKKDNNKLLSKEKKPIVSELVKAYEENELLVGKIKNTAVVRLRAEYKQRKKDRAYKSVKGFIQQLAVMCKTVENGMPRTDIAGRLQFAINQAEENERKGIVWNDKIEQDYLSFKKFNSMQGTNKQSTG